MADDDKTEKATPKKRDEARKKGQVAKSPDLNGAVVHARRAVRAVAPSAPHARRPCCRASMRDAFDARSPRRTSSTAAGLGPLVSSQASAAAPRRRARSSSSCVAAGVLANVARSAASRTSQALKPDFKQLNPITGFKNLFGPNALFEAGKNVAQGRGRRRDRRARVSSRSSTSSAALVGMPPGAAAADARAHGARRSPSAPAIAYLLIGVVDYAYQRYRHEKSLKMDKQEVKEEHKQHGAPGRGQRRDAPPPDAGRPRPHDGRRPDRRRRRHQPDPLRRRAALRRRRSPAPEVVAKGTDLLALQIREIAAETRRARSSPTRRSRARCTRRRGRPA